MARKISKPAEPIAGLFKNGTRWWVRTVRAPLTGAVKPLSTGTTDIARANAIVGMRDAMARNPTQYVWLSLAVAGEVSLDTLYTHHAAGTLDRLAAQMAVAAATDADPNLDPWVAKWATEHLATLDISAKTKEDYERQVRALIPAGVRFVASRFNEDVLKAKLATLTGARHDRDAVLSSGAKRRYVVAWQLFYKYARKRAPITTGSPFEDADWIPSNGSPRSTTHDFTVMKRVLARMTGEYRAAMALVYGSGIELGGLLDMKGSHVGPKDSHWIIVPGRHSSLSGEDRKNDHRNERTIFVDAWAWEIFYPHGKLITPRGEVWTITGKQLRDAFYAAQVAEELIDAPKRSKTTGKLWWGRVKPHTIHDARHSYCENRSLGLDGEEPQDAAYCANQLGHVDETMVLKIYKKKNVKERLRLIKLQRERQAAKAAATAS